MSGLNLQIAHAAAEGGFNTWRHEALFNLIWSVRRVLLLKGSGRTNPNAASAPPPPPPHPIYPDRYRPSGVGDNTSRKRRLPDDGKPPPFHTVRPLTRIDKKRIIKPKAARFMRGDFSMQPARPFTGSSYINSTSTGMQHNPISLDSDQESMQDGAATCKRKKLNNGLSQSVKVKTENGASVHQNTAASSFTQQADFIAFSDQLSTPPPPNHSSATIEILQSLRTVQKFFRYAQGDMDTCFRMLKVMFDKHAEKFVDPEIMTALENLSEYMGRVRDNAIHGIREVNDIVDLVQDQKEVIP